MFDEEIEINPRSAREAGRRLIVLASLIRRGFLEAELAADALGDEVEDERFDILAWLADSGIIDELESTELELLGAPIGQILADDVLEYLFQVDGALSVAWYLKLKDEMPEFLSLETQAGLLEAIPAPWDSIEPWLRTLECRSLEELALQREHAEVWNWRVESEEQRHALTDQALKGVESTIRETAIEAVNAGLLSNLIDRDFPVGDRAFRALEPEEQDIVSVAAYDRVRAFNWLCGYGESWSEAPTEI